MEAFSSYVLSVAGVILLGVLVNIILPEGTMSKYIQNIFAIIVVFVIVSPIGNIINSSFQIGNVIKTSNIVLDERFITLVNEQKITQLTFIIEKEIEDCGFKNVFVTISANLLSNPLNIQKVEVNLSNLVMKGQVQHINKYSKIKELVLKHINIKEEHIVFYG